MLTKICRRPFFTMGLYMVFYFIAFGLLEAWQRPYHIVYCRMDALIPFCRYAVVPYVLWFVWVPFMLLLFLRRDRAAFWRLFGSIALGTASALVIYAVFPTAQLLRRTLYGRDVFTMLIRLIYRADTPTNVCPSLHVFVSVAILLAVYSSSRVIRKRWQQNACLYMTLAICASTVLIRQHSCVDVVCGMALAACTFAVTQRRTGRVPRAVPGRA